MGGATREHCYHWVELPMSSAISGWSYKWTLRRVGGDACDGATTVGSATE